jgi:hypothetical protein
MGIPRQGLQPGLGPSREPGEKRQFGGRQANRGTAGADAFGLEVDDQLAFGERLLNRVDAIGKARLTLDQRAMLRGAQSHERNPRQIDLGRLAVVGNLLVALLDVDWALAERGIVKLAMTLERRGHQHMREAILRATEQRQGIADEIAHALAPSRDGDMQRAVHIVGKAAHQIGNEIGGANVVIGRANVFQRASVATGNDMDVFRR